MDKENNKNKLVNYEDQLADHQDKFLTQLSNIGLPIENIFVPIKDRVVVFSNAGLLLDNIDIERRAGAVYISKFFAAVGAGLFDAALNYIWDETILHLRKRIEAYDLEYFYDIATSPEKRKELKTIEDISKITDDELLKGSLAIELITEVGYRNMDLVRYMRNNASAAHPNQLDITGLKLISMAEDCLREVISTPIPPAAINVQKLLENIKSKVMAAKDAHDISVHFSDMGPKRTQRLAEGLFGIFCKRETSELIKQNIRFLIPLLWDYIEEETRKNFGIRHAYFSANNHISEKNSAREFLSIVNGLGYITDQHRAMEISLVLNELKNAHDSLNNFYNETLPAKRLRSIIGNPPKIPNGIDATYIKTLVDVFLTNGNGICWSANEIYLELITSFSPRQAIYAISLIFDESISSKVQVKLCSEKYIEILTVLEPKISTQSGKQLINEIHSNKFPLSEIKNEETLKKLAKISIDEPK